ncbi:glycine-rich RNA-binding protein 4, mitochondrial-like [Aristolochia californica]|uniref:glycine-rich RNA-binding protein 4, mitochondrial-like n=1 Tax=Aristolochia californica TaxID=171875 RepID=UPI0035E2FDAE
MYKFDSVIIVSGKCTGGSSLCSSLSEMHLSRVGSLSNYVLRGKRFFSHQPCSKLFVGGLSYDTNEVVLKEAFENYGKVLHVNVVCDRNTSKSKGYGFVKFATEAEAATALQKMDGQLLDGWNLRVSYANKD